jgi:hypothetical protein
MDDPPPSAFPDIGKVQSMVRAHPIYQWFEAHIPEVLARAIDARSEIQLVQLLLRCMTIAFWEAAGAAQPAKGVKERRDKKRNAARNAIDRVERFMDDVTILLPPAKEDMLRNLLAEAKSELTRKSPRGPEFRPYLGLEALAYALYQELGIADPRILLDVASALELGDFTDRTAQRYVEKARKP